MRNKLILIVLPLLLCLGCSSLLFDQKEVSSLERRELKNIDNLKDSSLFDYSLQDNIEDVVSDQFIFRNSMISFYNEMIINISNLFSDSFIMYHNDILNYQGYLLDPIIKTNNSYSENLKNRAYNIKSISEKYPDLPIYVYKPTRLEETNLIDIEHIYSKGSDNNYMYWGELGNVTYKVMDINSVDMYKDFYYKTDLHWNPKGAYQGYTDIIELLNNNFELGDVKEKEEMICYQKDFHGSYSNKIGQKFQPENLCDIKVKGIGTYKYFENDKEVFIDEIKQNYINGIFLEQYSDYDNYFGNNPLERRFEFGDNTGVNALFFVDSYINVNKTWIASHFDTTIMLDMRSKPKDFNLDEYIVKYDIDTIVVSMYHYNLYENGYNFIPIE